VTSQQKKYYINKSSADSGNTQTHLDCIIWQEQTFCIRFGSNHATAASWDSLLSHSNRSICWKSSIDHQLEHFLLSLIH